MTDRKINWKFTAQDQTGAAFRSIDSKLSGLTRGLKTFAGFAGFAAVARGIGSVTAKLVTLGSELSDVGQQFGISVEKLQGLKFAAEQTGSSFEGVQRALTALTRNTGEALRGTEKFASAFKALEIDLESFTKLPLEKRLGVIADATNRIEDPVRRLEFRLKLLGRGATDLGPALDGGSRGLEEFQRQAEATGILTDEQARKLDAAGDAWDRFKQRVLVAAAAPTVGVLSFTGEVLSGLTNFLDNVSLAFDGVLGKTKQLGAGVEQALAPALAPLDLSGIETPEQKRAREKAEREAAAAFKRFRENIEREIEAIQKSTATPFENYQKGLERTAELQEKYGLSAEDAARRTNQLAQEFANAQRAQFDLTAEGIRANQMWDESRRLIEGLTTPLEAYEAQLERIRNLVEAGGFLSPDLAVRAYAQAMEEYIKATGGAISANDALSDSTKALLQDIRTAAEGFARELTDVFFDATKSIGDMFKSLAETIAKALFTNLVTGPLIEGILGGLNIPGRAAGGPVTGGSPYIVGERGPELFVPRQSGSIIPNGAGNNIALNLTITSIDPQTAAATIVAQERLITNMVRRSFQRAGLSPRMA